MIHGTLRGWNVTVEKTTIQEPRGPDGPMADAPGWTLTFLEMVPPTGNTLHYTVGREVRDYIVRELTGGVVLHGGNLPSI